MEKEKKEKSTIKQEEVKAAPAKKKEAEQKVLTAEGWKRRALKRRLHTA